MGTVNVLEAVRARPTTCARWSTSRPTSATRTASGSGRYREDEPMGGHDPYSSSQGLRGAGHRAPTGARSSPTPTGRGWRSARAGNVIGGGDWGEDRLIPDIMRAALDGRAVRDPQPGRDPPVAARAQPAERLPACWPQALLGRPRRSPTAWNFGPAEERRAAGRRGSSSASPSCGPASCAGQLDAGAHPHEARLPAARLVARPARGSAGRRAGTSTRRSTAIVEWYAALRDGADMRARRRSRRSTRSRARPATLPQRMTPAAAASAAPRSRPCSPTSACRRWRTRYLAAGAARTRWSRSIRCARWSARSASSCSSRSSRRPSAIFSDYAYFSSYSTTLARALAPLRRRDGRALRARRDEPRRRDRLQRRLPAAVLRRARRSPCSASSRRRTSPRSRVEKGVPTLVEFFGVETARERSRPSASADLLLGNNVLAHVPDLNDFVGGHEGRCSKPGGVDHDGVPAPDAADRGEPVRHDLPRALLVLLVH